VRGVRAALDDKTALIGFAGAPWTVATYMVEGSGSRDYATIKTWAFRDPDGFQRLIDLLVAVTADYLSAQVDAGAEALQLFDTWAAVLPAAAARRWSLEPMKRIVERLRIRHPTIPIIIFPRGVGPSYEAFAVSGACNALSLDQNVPLDWAVEHLQSRVALQGNLDPLYLLVGGSALRDEANRILDGLGRGPFIFNLGHGITPAVPPDHVAELVDVVRRWQA
jgi:uroporphyrinogen decarboxylase